MKTAGKNKKTMSNRVALYGLLIALAFVLSYIETLFPVYLGAPGVKLGLANLVTVIALYGLGIREAFAINLVRVILTGFTFGNMSSILFGLAGAVLSLLLMALCKQFQLLDMTGQCTICNSKTCCKFIHVHLMVFLKKLDNINSQF